MSPGTKIALALLVLGLLSYLPYHVVKHDSGQEYQRLKAEVENMKAGNERLREQNTRLRMRIDALRTDPRLLERQARERLLVARPDETILIFPPDQAQQRPSLPPAIKFKDRPRSPETSKAPSKQNGESP